MPQANHLRKIIGHVGFFILLYFIARAYFHKGFDKYMYVTEVAVAFTVIAIGVLYWTYKPQIEKFTEKIKMGEERKEYARKLHEELKDGLESLDGTLPRMTIESEYEGEKIYYKHVYLNHKVFEGLVNSGDFNYIDYSLQQSLQNIYRN